MNDTIIFFVLAGLALVFKWLTSKGEQGAEKREPPAPNETAGPQRPPPQSEEERVRRFMEALGMPTGTPPPTARRRAVTPAAPPAQRPKPPKRSWAQPLPPLVTTPEDLSEMPPFTAVPLESTATATPPPVVVAPSPLPLPVTRPSASQPPVPVSSLGAMLRARGSIRRAIILREVLGPPRGLQAFEEPHASN
ncbi:MAG: hypothetical protein ABI016_07250 [Chthoniobacterales bacterium]